MSQSVGSDNSCAVDTDKAAVAEHQTMEKKSAAVKASNTPLQQGSKSLVEALSKQMRQLSNFEKLHDLIPAQKQISQIHVLHLRMQLFFVSKT